MDDLTLIRTFMLAHRRKAAELENEDMTDEQIENELKDYLGVDPLESQDYQKMLTGLRAVEKAVREDG